MKALSIKQPWASLIAHGIKDIENRTWKTNFRGRIFIHASQAEDRRFKFDETNPLTVEQLKSISNNNWGNGRIYSSAIIGEVDIVDCVINHESIWAEQSLTKPDVKNDKYYKNPYLDNCSFDQKLYNKDLIDFENSKPIYNWVLANAVLYDKPILNVKGKLSFWDWKGCEQTCESCEKDFDMDTMQRDGDDNYFCKECAHELFPIMQKEYEEMVEKGEIEPNEKCYHCTNNDTNSEINECERCGENYCQDCSSTYNQFTQIDYNCCDKCAENLKNN